MKQQELTEQWGGLGVGGAQMVMNMEAESGAPAAKATSVVSGRQKTTACLRKVYRKQRDA